MGGADLSYKGALEGVVMGGADLSYKGALEGVCNGWG